MYKQGEGSHSLSAISMLPLTHKNDWMLFTVPPEIIRGILGGVKQGFLDDQEEVEVATVTEGGHAVLECYLRKGSPTPNRNWSLYPHTPLPLHFKVSNNVLCTSVV